MSKPKRQDPEKRAAKGERRKRRREAEARGAQMLPRRARPTAQMDHGTNPKAARQAREGERAMHRERKRSMSVCISDRGEFSSHDLDALHTCVWCHVLDEDALRAELRALRNGVPTSRQNGKSALPTLDEVRERRVPLDGQVLARAEFDSTAYDGNDHEGAADIERANLITSIVDAGRVSHLGGDFAMHKVVLDVDLSCRLVASSTPGHFHLFIDHEMTWGTYRALLGALARAGVVESGYVAAAMKRGHTAVRLPWVRKPAA